MTQRLHLEGAHLNGSQSKPGSQGTVKMSEAQHFAKDLSCCSVSSSSSENNQDTRCPPEIGQGMAAGICVTRICSHYSVTNLINQQHLKQKV